ncbi:MAG: hypothetical protein U5R48_19385 [Gammaproteobacteria bacterium]|nr:hypothetical protein [Gammaproteobacteria bacterium]
MDLDTGVDNIDVAADGSVWVAGHPHLDDFLAHARDPSARSATEVYRIVLEADGARVDLVLRGTTAAGSPAAASRWPGATSCWWAPCSSRKLLRCTLAPEHAVRPTRRSGLLERPAAESGEPEGSGGDTQPADG